MANSIEPLTKENFDAWLEFFDKRALKDNPKWDGCYCQHYLHSDTEMSEQEEIRSSGVSLAEFNREKSCKRISNNSLQGYLAFENGKVIGWLSAGAAEIYKQFPSSEEGEARVICFTIDPNYRNQGIAKALLQFAISDLKGKGFKFITGRGVYQVESESKNYPGPISLYESVGFREIIKLSDDFGLMRLDL